MKYKFNKIFYKTLFSIALPITIQNLIITLLNLIDVFMISSLDTSSIGGVGMANKIFFLLNLFLFGTNSGAAILASQYWGNKDINNIKKVLGITLILGSLGSLLFSVAAILFPAKLISILSPDEPGIISEGAKYLRIIGFSYILTAITITYSFMLRAINNAKLPMIVTGIAIIINTFFNWVLIFGNLGAPKLGVEGAAIATVGARLFESVFIVFLVYKYKLPIAGKITEYFRFTFGFFKHYLSTVFFVILNEVVWSVGVFGYSLVYGRMGEVPTASMVITQTIEQLSFVAFFGISNACGVMLGNKLGANEIENAEEYAKIFLALVIKLGIFTSILIILVSPYIAGLFNVELIIKENVISCLRVFSIYLPFKVINMIIIVGILRSGGDTIASLLIDLFGVWLVGIPMAILGGLYFKLDIKFVYAMIMSEELVKFIFSVLRYRSKKWVKNIVINSPL